MFTVVKKKSKSKKKSCTLKDILDSDDELPTEYIDLPFVPAYQMDNRFEHIEKVNKYKEPSKQSRDVLSKVGTVVACGYLNKKDTFCFQSLRPNTCKKTQKWFFNFLMTKDLNASFTFLNTCLVPSYGNSYFNANRKYSKDCNDFFLDIKW